MAPNEGAAANLIPKITVGIGQMNSILGAGLTLLATYKAARDAWKAAHPTLDSPFLDDHQLVDLLRKDADSLVAHVDQVIAKHSTPGDPAAATAGDPTGGA